MCVLCIWRSYKHDLRYILHVIILLILTLIPILILIVIVILILILILIPILIPPRAPRTSNVKVLMPISSMWVWKCWAWHAQMSNIWSMHAIDEEIVDAAHI